MGALQRGQGLEIRFTVVVEARSNARISRA